MSVTRLSENSSRGLDQEAIQNDYSSLLERNRAIDEYQFMPVDSRWIPLASHYTLTVSEKIATDEKIWLKDNPHRPSIRFANNEISLKIYRPGLSGREFIGNIIPYNIYRKSDLVEVSFDFQHEGKRYFFTATRVTKLGKTCFNAVFTELLEEDRDDSDGEVGIRWQMVPAETAAGFLDLAVVQKKMAETLTASGKDCSLEDYIAEVRAVLPDVSYVKGYQKYDVRTGFYVYEQRVLSSNATLNWLVRSFGAGDVMGAALKASYATLSKPELAGGEGVLGPEIESLGGATVQAGR